jgi:hypothetical protein
MIQAPSVAIGRIASKGCWMSIRTLSCGGSRQMARLKPSMVRSRHGLASAGISIRRSAPRKLPRDRRPSMRIRVLL